MRTSDTPLMGTQRYIAGIFINMFAAAGVGYLFAPRGEKLLGLAFFAAWLLMVIFIGDAWRLAPTLLQVVSGVVFGRSI